MGQAGALILSTVWALAAGGVGAQEVPYSALVAPAPGVSVCPGGLCQVEALNPLFAAWAETEAGRRAAPVRIVQFGDSHTAGGLITARLRSRLQARFGYAGGPAAGVASGAGVDLVEIGAVSATLRDFAEWPEAGTADGADLVILAFGTNEGFDDALDLAAYEILLRGQVKRITQAGVPLLVLGAPDGLRSGARIGCSADGQRAPPPSLVLVRDVQRRVAADMGVAFWDWHGRMGGDCSADRLALMVEPYMRGDRVHFTSAGADWIGGVLGDDLMAAYGGWIVRQGGGA